MSDDIENRKRSLDEDTPPEAKKAKTDDVHDSASVSVAPPQAETQPASTTSPGRDDLMRSEENGVEEHNVSSATYNGVTDSMDEESTTVQSHTAPPAAVPAMGTETPAGETPTVEHIKNHVQAPETPAADPGPRDQTPLDIVQLKFCLKMIKTSKRVKDAAPFLQPVDPIKLGIPTYFDVVKKPIDISTIQGKLERNVYRLYDEFKADLDLMFSNCYLFNSRDSIVSKIGQNLEKYYAKQLEKLPLSVSTPAVAQVNNKKRSSSDLSMSVPRPKRETAAPSPSLMLLQKGGNKITPELKFAVNVIREIMKPKYWNINYPFLEPVDHVKLGIPTYPLIIKNPMDLGTILKRLEAGFYSSTVEFESDVRLVFTNCRTFNQAGTDVFEMGRKLENLFDQKWRARPTTSKRDKYGDDEEDGSSSDDGGDVATFQQSMMKMMAQVSKLARPKKKKSKDKKAKMHSSSKLSKSSRRESHKAMKSSEDTVREVTYEQKRELSERINDLPAEKLETVYQIIRSGIPHLDTSAGQDEIELDIDSLDRVTLYKLYKFVKNSTKAPATKNSKPSNEKLSEARPKSKPKGLGDDSESSGSSSSGSDSDSGSDSNQSSTPAELRSSETAVKEIQKPGNLKMLSVPSVNQPSLAPPKKVPAPSKKTEIFDVFQLLGDFEMKNTEQVKEPEKKSISDVKKGPPSAPSQRFNQLNERGGERNQISSHSGRLSPEPDFQTLKERAEKRWNEELKSVDWLDIHRAGAVISEFEDSVTKDAEDIALIDAELLEDQRELLSLVAI